MSTNAFTFLMLPPQTPLYRGWAKRLADTVPGVNVVVAETEADAEAAIASADAYHQACLHELYSDIARRLRERWRCRKSKREPRISKSDGFLESSEDVFA